MKTGIKTQVSARIAPLTALKVILERTLSLRIILGGVEGIRIGYGPGP
ncbi:MAG: hypothetical protein ACOX6Z_01910 [Dethiobacteria bacterium]|jgi:hypothetical protein